jgi:DNA-binding NarL/FixJ family response regulator
VILVALIEDNRLVREGLATMLGQVPDIQVVAAEATFDIVQLCLINPKVILLDVGLHTADSLRVAEEIKRDCPGAKILVMDLLPVHEEVVAFINAGVAGFIMKDATLEDLVQAIRTVAEGVRVLPPQMSGTLFSWIVKDAMNRSQAESLNSVRMTPREREVINQIAEGHSNKEIAERLNIAAYTVRSHVRNVMEKLMLHTRLQIAAYAHRDGTM